VVGWLILTLNLAIAVTAFCLYALVREKDQQVSVSSCSAPRLAVKRPEIYYGEKTRDYVFVHTNRE
jgi:uncharacterized membrane protein (UPF0182 family)